MFRKSILSLLVLVLAATLVYAEKQEITPPAPSQGTTPSPVQNSQVRGIVNKIDMQAKVITVRDEATGQTQEILFDDTTAFSKQSGAATATDLSQDDRVTIEVDSTNTAVRVTVEPTKPTAEASENPQNS